MIRISKHAFVLAVSLLLVAAAQSARAHSMWLKTLDLDGKPNAFFYFGESLSDEAYKLPAALTNVEIWQRAAGGERTQLTAKSLNTDDRIGLIAPLDERGPYALEASALYGNYHGILLTYYAKHAHANADRQLANLGPSKELKLDAVASVKDGEARVAVTWNGKPLADTSVQVAVGKTEPGEKKTDARGTITFRPEQAGLVSVQVSITDKEAKGEHKGDAYTSAMNILTFTFDWHGSAAKLPASIAPLPEPLASFGAATADGWLYVYGGHIGEPHDHSAANLSRHFRRTRVESGREWEELPMQAAVQGLALVAHGGKIYRIGGMNARNATTDDTADLHSTDEFAVYDPAKREWAKLAPLPAGRSSHDAIVFDDKLYVVGGWTLSGKGNGKWIDDAIVYDLAKPAAGWQALPKAPFQRRALAAGVWHGKLVAIGGIDGDGAVLQDVSLFDPAKGEWSDGPKLPADDMAGFGVSAWNLNGALYVSGLPGTLYRLSDDGKEWKGVAELQTPRFFHRLLPAPRPNTLMAIGGAAEDGHVADAEMLEIQPAVPSAR